MRNAYLLTVDTYKYNIKVLHSQERIKPLLRQ